MKVKNTTESQKIKTVSQKKQIRNEKQALNKKRKISDGINKKAIRILGVVIAVLLLFTLFYTIDNSRVKHNKKPIFAIKIAIYKDGGSTKYQGFFYQVLKCNTLLGDNSLHIGHKLDVNKICVIDPTFDPTSTSDYMFNYKNSPNEVLFAIGLGYYGNYKFQRAGKYLRINYKSVENMGDIIENEEILIEKSSLIFALLDNVNKIVWKTPNNKRTVTRNEIYKDKGIYAEIFGKSSINLNQLLIRLGYYNTDPIAIEVLSAKKDSIKIKIINKTNKVFEQSKCYALQEYKNGKWEYIDIDNSICPTNGEGLFPNEELIREYSIKSELPSNNKLRILKVFDEAYLNKKNEVNYKKSYVITKEFEIK